MINLTIKEKYFEKDKEKFLYDMMRDFGFYLLKQVDGKYAIIDKLNVGQKVFKNNITSPEELVSSLRGVGEYEILTFLEVHSKVDWKKKAKISVNDNVKRVEFLCKQEQAFTQLLALENPWLFEDANLDILCKMFEK